MTPEMKPHYAMPAAIPAANTDWIERKMFDLAYAHLSASQKLDIYWPEEGSGPFPVIVSIHGGAFMGGDKRDIQLTPMLAGLKRGYVVVGCNYRMSGEAIFPALVHDIKAAVRWLRANAEVYRLDPERIAVWGGSAGGYLALMAGVSAGIPELDDPALGSPDQSCAVQAVVSWFPPSDFLAMDEQLDESGFLPPPQFAHSGENSPESRLLGRQITEIPDRVRAADPATYLRLGLPPFFIQHGRLDDTVPYQQSRNFARKLAAIDPSLVAYEILPGARHADPAFETPQNVQKVLDFLDRALRS
ncbi:MAG: prolyl oligopeptidase family serine peptidase [Chloroflexota bacterium]